MRTGQNTDDRRANAGFETVLLGGVIVGETFLHLARRERAPVRTSRKCADDLVRARVLFLHRLGITGEHAIPAGRAQRRRDLEGPSDLEAPGFQHLHPSARTHTVSERGHQILGLGVRPTRKQHGHLVLAGLDGEANVLQPTVDGIDAGRLLLIDRSQIFVAADARLVDDLAVEGDHDSVGVLNARGADRPDHVFDRHRIFAGDRKCMRDHEPVARAKG